MSGRCVGEVVIPDDLAKALNETIHYLEHGSDYFSVSVGGYEIKYDETKSTSDAKGDK